MRIKKTFLRILIQFFSIYLLFYLIHLTYIVFINYYGRTGATIESWLPAILLPKEILGRFIWTIQFSSPALLVLILYFIFSKFNYFKKKNGYIIYLLILFAVYLILSIYNFFFCQDLNDCFYTFIDDLPNKWSHDFEVVFGYFAGSMVFMLFFIPLWKVFNKWLDKKFPVKVKDI